MSRTTLRRTWVRPASAPNADINVTPLVDVVLVLLIIFMVVTPMMTPGMQMSWCMWPMTIVSIGIPATACRFPFRCEPRDSGANAPEIPVPPLNWSPWVRR